MTKVGQPHLQHANQRNLSQLRFQKMFGHGVSAHVDDHIGVGNLTLWQPRSCGITNNGQQGFNKQGWSNWGPLARPMSSRNWMKNDLRGAAQLKLSLSPKPNDALGSSKLASWALSSSVVFPLHFLFPFPSSSSSSLNAKRDCVGTALVQTIFLAFHSADMMSWSSEFWSCQMSWMGLWHHPQDMCPWWHWIHTGRWERTFPEFEDQQRMQEQQVHLLWSCRQCVHNGQQTGSGRFHSHLQPLFQGQGCMCTINTEGTSVSARERCTSATSWRHCSGVNNPCTSSSCVGHVRKA